MANRPGSPSLYYVLPPPAVGHPNGIEAKARKHARGYLCVWKLVNSAIIKAKKNAKTRRRYDCRTEEQRREALASTAKWQRGNGAQKKRDYTRRYFKDRRETDHNFYLATNLRNRVREALKYRGVNKAGKTFGKCGLVGCSKPEFQKHIASTFQDGMRHDNTDIDHIWPLALYNLQDTSQQKMAFNWQNCHAMWPSDNKTKKDTVPSRELAVRVPRHLWPPEYRGHWP